jgi:hypothetical protein
LIPAKSERNVPCRERTGYIDQTLPVLFEPERNYPGFQSLHDISIYYLLSKALESRVERNGRPRKNKSILGKRDLYCDTTERYKRSSL